MLTYDRDPNSLQPDFRQRSDAASAEILAHPAIIAAGVVALVDTETGRSQVAQLLNFLRGRMKLTADLDTIYKEFYGWTLDKKSAENIATETLKSKHISGLARDRWLSKDGKTPWKSWPEELHVVVGQIVRKRGLTWGGDWKKYGLYEPWHWEAK